MHYGCKPAFTSLQLVGYIDIYLLASATEDEPDTDERAIHGLEGWIACYEKCRLAGTVFAGGVTEPGAVAGHPALETARAMGAAIA